MVEQLVDGVEAEGRRNPLACVDATIDENGGAVFAETLSLMDFAELACH